MKINIISVGTLSKEFQVIFDDYIKKINFYSNVNLIKIKEFKSNNKDLIIKNETMAILEKIPKNSKVFLCSLNAEQYSSEKFALFLQEDNISFVIGGSHGVDEKMFKGAWKINFSKMTFPHQLFHLMLIEQIYRGFSILNNKIYHK
ncbi:23S rRNA (pseudouridine(1915)-N(3))-methyltransferase RlmH [Mycoplasmopsis pulmonis]|uniref:Ribosomal RNA large subunit methyltransferase H n=1 Tax=Mycoplasmopsis pulmonis (strain UAB CTIP) TaxID=272635 RepID=RLMH_MYCPU|nr:23S rRNA (pseudouridine(1915)-N(3))-methyltransferase RlmH [Mycoplasmopsis pulmonis]Q98QV7.2 RecName: Full=Ribosomal RNA large subunit methyltransferase H; AltName: Full=23S rRNA (pseudouridine1915-N3)-methyltransferase; AltName: Full=23S rRNA m3Psi1915 methyltransferase; AltName: Full=rRNA (pseudouridine-N3-)-methyltransferase RlmH [Mycoplasmopsis pulmonis UAB CTIP]MDZ7293213.1 23S rRNA (pseudouridine(1915)-N(3))-methyltransferase RlmH [Mycoplasmopsis pulmonis]VEU68014.1 Ribosomal RNA large 